MKKGINMFLAFVIVGVLLTGCAQTVNNQPEGSSTIAAASSSTAVQQTTTATLFDKPVKLSLLTEVNASWPYQEDWYILNLIKERTNVTFDITTAPEANYQDKLSVMVAGGTLPDLCQFYEVAPYQQKYGPDGIIINVLAHKSELPAFSAWYDKNKQIADLDSSADGSLYVFPQSGGDYTNMFGWFYREDIFKKNNLAVPTTQEEFYSVLKKLKELYPSSYPMAFRGGIYNMSYYLRMFGIDDLWFFKDNTDSKWKYGPIEPGCKQAVTLLNQLYTEKIIPPDCLTIDTKGWVDLLSNSNAFITCDMLVRIDFFNNAVRPTNPDFTMAYMDPFTVTGGASGSNKMRFGRASYAGIGVNATSPHLKTALKFLDWTYTDEGIDLLSWGKEGETYTIVDGKKKFKPEIDSVTALRKDYGIFNGFSTAFDTNAILSLNSPELSYAINQAIKFEDQPNMSMYTKLTQEEADIESQTGSTIATRMGEHIANFIIGQEPLSSWDKYVKEINDLGLDKMLAIYEASGKRAEDVLSAK